jgi:3-isopropylmalate dehydrogenase
MAEVKSSSPSTSGHAGFETEEGLVGGCAYDAHGKAISDETWTRRLPPTR